MTDTASRRIGVPGRESGCPRGTIVLALTEQGFQTCWLDSRMLFAIGTPAESVPETWPLASVHSIVPRIFPFAFACHVWPVFTSNAVSQRPAWHSVSMHFTKPRSKISPLL